MISRLIVSDANAKHVKNMEHLHEANKFAQWSEQDRLSKLPSITPEQRQQIHQYLSIVQQHGLSKSVAQAQEQEGSNENVTTNAQCPILSNNHKTNSSVNTK